MAKLKVLLIEDNRLLRDGTTALLNAQEDIRAVSSPGNRSALEKAKKLVPDVVLLDLGLKSHSSLKVLESIRKHYPKAEIVVMDLLPTHADLVEYVKAGISGFIPRDATLDDFLHTIRSVAKGSKILPPTMERSLFSQIVGRAIESGAANRVLEAVKMTKREQDVTDLLAKGHGITETSLRLKIAVHTVKSHLRNILDKFALYTRLDLAARGAEEGTTEITPVRDEKSRD